MTAAQLDLFPKSRRSDPETSKRAAQRVAVIQGSLRARILEALVRPLSDDELCGQLGIETRRWPSVKTARSALYTLGHLVWTGEVRNGQRVWQVYSTDVPTGDAL